MLLRKLFFFMLCPFLIRATIIQSPDGTYCLENKFLRAIVDPISGGRIISLHDKRNGTEYTSGAWDMGIAGDANWQDRSLRASKWYRQACLAEPGRDDAGNYLSMSSQGSGGMMQWMTLNKTYRLSENSSSLHVDYRLSVNSNAMADLVFCPWLHNSAFVKEESGIMSFAAESGVRRLFYDPAASANESFHYDLTDGWFTYSSKEVVKGLAFVLPYQDLMCFYNWQGSQGNTMEIMFRSQKIPCGEDFIFRMSIMLYDGISAPDGVSNTLAGQFLLDDNSLDGIKIYFAEDFAGKVSISSRRLPERLESPLYSQDMSGLAGSLQTIPFKYQPSGDALYEIVCRITDETGLTILTMKAPIQHHGTEKISYQRQPEIPRRGSDEERFGQLLLSASDRLDCYTWHHDLPLAKESRPWLRPYSGGKVRLLILTDVLCGREVSELAGRMDAEFETCTFSGRGRMPWNPVWQHGGGLNETNIYLGELLKKDYDGILLAGLQIKYISLANRQRMAELVNRGATLVSVMPNEIPDEMKDLFPAVPAIKPVYQTVEAKLQMSAAMKVSPASPVRNLPLNSLPPIHIFPYESKNSVINSGGFPLLCLGKYGKGKTALFTWLTGRPDNTTQGGICPTFMEEPHFPWQDYFYAMIIQTILWGVDRQPVVSVEKITDDKSVVSIDISNRQKNTLQVMLNCQLRHESGMFGTEFEVPASLTPGDNHIELSTNGWKLLGGKNFLDVRLTAENLALDFAVVNLLRDNCPQIGGVAFEDRIYREGEVLPVNVSLSGLTGQMASLRFILSDPFGRLLVNESIPAKPVCSLDLPLQNLYTQRGYLVVECYISNQLCARKKMCVDLLPGRSLKRDWNEYLVLLSWPIRDTRAFPFFLRPAWQETMSDLGVNAVLQAGIPTFWGHDSEKYALMYRSNLPIIMESLARLSARCRLPYYQRPPFDYRWRQDVIKRQMEQYNQSKDRKHLYRDPILDDPEFSTDFTQALQKWIPEIKKWHPIMYDLGDEISYGNFANPLDLDFSPQSLQQFRLWLQTQYSSLEELNHEWCRAYQNWSEVEPDTALEARARDVYSAWGMHRTYNAKVLADFLSMAAEIIRKSDPGALITMSGTQEPKAYNGYDWTKLMPIFDSLSAYTSNGMPEILRSWKTIPQLGWTGYGAGQNEIARTVWNNLFNGHYGVGLYNEMVLLNPDLSLTDSGKDIRDILKPIRQGVGTLLYNCYRLPSEVALHYSQASAVATWIVQGESDFSSSRLRWVELIKGMGYNHRFISSEEIEQGILQQGAIKVLCLPFSLALSDKEVREMTNFQNKGGLLVADRSPGQFSNRFVRHKLPRLEPLGAMIFDDLLPIDQNSPKYQEVREKLVQEFHRRQIRPSQRILDFPAGIENHSFALCQGGGQVIAAWLRQDEQVSIKRHSDVFLYDVIQGQLVQKEILTVQANAPKVWVALPYQVDHVEVKLEPRPGNAWHCRAKVVAKPSDSKLLRHFFRFEVRGPDGVIKQHYSSVCHAPSGQADHTFYPGINESGTWVVTAIDIISGVRTEVRTLPTLR